MATIPPFVRHMIVCDDAVPSSRNPAKMDARGMVSFVRSHPPGRFPVVVPMLCVLLEVSGGRGVGELRVEFAHAEAEGVGFRSAVHLVTFPDDPLRVLPLVFRIRECVFREPGLYWVQFTHNGRKVSEVSVIVE